MVVAAKREPTGRPKRIAIIGANEFQNPLILAAKARGLETHVFAWESGDAGEKTADFFHPISITEKEAILEVCRELEVEGVATIASDLANITVSYVANGLGLTANSLECVERSTDKELMRRTFEKNGDPSPKSIAVRGITELDDLEFDFPVIVKPSDRSGSRGITKVHDRSELPEAVERALAECFGGTVLVEEFVEGDEYSVEYISWEGRHQFLALTEKFTSGAPMFIELGHLEPARVSKQRERDICEVVEHALDSLGVTYGASHSEVKVDSEGNVKIIEIGSRMGGDCIGSHLVKLSRGYDFVDAVLDVALGQEPPSLTDCANEQRFAAVRFVFGAEDEKALSDLERWAPERIALRTPICSDEHEIVDSSSRYGFFVFSGESLDEIERYLPSHDGERSGA